MEAIFFVDEDVVVISVGAADFSEEDFAAMRGLDAGEALELEEEEDAAGRSWGCQQGEKNEEKRWINET